MSFFKRKPKNGSIAKMVLYKDGSFLFECDTCNIASTGYICSHYPSKTEVKDRREIFRRKKK